MTIKSPFSSEDVMTQSPFYFFCKGFYLDNESNIQYDVKSLRITIYKISLKIIFKAILYAPHLSSMHFPAAA